MSIKKGRMAMVTSSQASRLIPEGTRPMTGEEIKTRDKINEENKDKKGFKKNTRKTIDTPFGAAGKTYIKENYYEILLQRPVDMGHGAKPTSWGSFLEKYAYDQIPDGILPLDAKLVSDVRYRHPNLLWSGMPDVDCESADLVGDIKCPYSMTGLIKLLECMYSVEAFKSIHSDYYWQLVSNSVLAKRKNAMLIVFVPFLDQLEEIRERTTTPGIDQNKVSFINWAEDNDLPYLNRDGIVNNITTFKFEIPEEDKKYLTKKVRLAQEEVNKLLDADDRDIFINK